MAVAIAVVVAAPGASPAHASTQAKTAATPVLAVSHTSREVFGFALTSSLGDPTFGYTTWNFDLLSTVAIFGVHVDSASGQFAGDAGWSTWNSSTLTNLVSTAHQHGTKVVLTVILQDFTSNTPFMCAGLQHGDATVAETVQQVQAKGVDGVNIDYEGLDGSCGSNDPYWAQHAFTAFVAKMRAGLGSGNYLSVDTYASSAVDGYGFFDVRNIATYADSLFVMAYDLEYSNYSRSPVSCSRFCLGPTSPLTGYYYNDADIASQYAGAIGAGKVILGVPYYGRKACVGGAVPNAYPLSGVSADSYLDASSEASDPAVAAGSYAVHRDANSSGGERWDTWYNTSLGCTRELYWDDAVSLGKKYDLVKSAGLRGVGLWNLNYGGGAPELWAALAQRFLGCTGVTVKSSLGSPQAVTASITFTAAASGCPNPMFEFWILAPGGSWTVGQGYSASTSFTWKTAGLAPGTYNYSVWARDVASGAAYDAFAPGSPFVLVDPCTPVSVTAAPASGSVRGTVVTLTASAGGCTSPLYEFWIQPPGGSWTLARGYAAAATFSWSTSGLQVGTYRYSVWARNAGSPNAYDSFFPGAVYTVGASCTSVSASANPANGSRIGTAVTLTAAAVGCSNPQYEFWIQTPAGGWTMARAYGAGATFTWSTAGISPGTYRFSVWVRDGVSSAPYDAYFPGAAYTVLSPCTSVNATATPATTSPRGGTVTFTASASGCPNPVYEFWILPPGGTWTVVRAYASGNSFSWTTTGLPPGVYRFSVWVRDAASTAAYDAYFPGSPYTLG